MSDIYLMCGCPAQGKSTWIKEHIKPGDAHISRDEIRFLLLNNNDAYFSKEKEVLRLFKYNVEEHIKLDQNIYVDATFLTKKTRKWVLELASRYGVKISVIAFERPLETCLEWNEKREGRAYVPASAIRKMYEQFEEPTLEEGFDNIIIIEKGENYEYIS